jgi:hypothetical protein
MEFGDPLHDGQTKARTPGLPAVAPPEALKDEVALILGNGGSLIENADHLIAS